MDIEDILRIIVQKKYHILETRLSKYELVKGQADLLLLIKDNDGITQNELANIIGIKDSSMSVRLNKLEKLGYIIRENDLENLKKKIVYITVEGKKVSVQCRRLINEFEKLLFKGFGKKEKDNLEKSLEKMIKNIIKMKN